MDPGEVRNHAHPCWKYVWMLINIFRKPKKKKERRLLAKSVSLFPFWKYVGKGWAEGIVRELEMDTCTIFKINNHPGPAVQHTELFSMLHGRLEKRGFGGQCRCPVTESRAALCDPTGYSTPGFPVLHCPLEFARTRVRGARDVRMDICMHGWIPSPFTLSQHGSLAIPQHKIKTSKNKWINLTQLKNSAVR